MEYANLGLNLYTGCSHECRYYCEDFFIRIAGEMINHNPDALYPTERELDPLKDLNYQCVDDTFDLKVKADYMTLGLRGNGRNSTARIMNFQLTKNPELAFLWNMADNYSNRCCLWV